MTTKQELDASFDSLSETALRVKRERDLLRAAVIELLELVSGHVDCMYCGDDAKRAVRVIKIALRRTR
jgi:hypothetical protein